MPTDPKVVRDHFLALAELPAAQREAYLTAHCGDAELRAAVERLLAAHDQPASVLDRPVPGGLEQTGAHIPREEPGTVIAGKYKLLQQIGEGGMGSVWMADQTEPVKRRVAVKLIRVERGNSKAILSRFEAERQAIALMDHPHIAKLLDAGTSDAGQPFFVMELVKGIPLTDYCDTHRLCIQTRLGLFQQICSAVQHAHQKGIIHRDLKPSNILVESHDGRPVPKIIDFGLAKATSGMQLTENTLFTAFGSVMGTPLYMAPEQANFNAIDVDTRADIYALGVILYELLTGTTPLTRDTVKKAALDEMLKLVREQEAPTPSSRLSSAGSSPSVAANRQTETAKLGRFVKGELDWIVLKALSKERDRRYDTANGFARDIERFLNHEPVAAGPPSAGYKLRKFVQRNRGQVIAAGLVLFALLAGIAGTTWGLIRANRSAAAERFAKLDAEAKRSEAEHARAAEADRAEGERLAKLDAQAQKTNAEKAADAEKAANSQAQTRLRQIEKANDILGSIFDNLDPREIARAERPLQVILVEKLGKAVAQLEGESIGDPLVVAAMQAKFGGSLLGLGEAGKAIVLLEKARATRKAKLGPNHPDTLTSMHNLATAYQAARKWDLAIPLHEETLKLRKPMLGPDHPDTLQSMNNLATAYEDAGKLGLALPLFEQTLKLQKARLGPEHPSTLTTMHNLAVAYRAAGKLDLALPLCEETLKLMKARLGPEHPDTLQSMNNLALAYQTAGKRDLAILLHEETLKLRKAKLGPDHPDTLTSMNNLANAYHAAGKRDLALPLLEETLKLSKARLGPDHPSTLSSMNNLAAAYHAAGKRDLALPLYEETLKLRKAKLGSEHPDTLTSMNNLANAYHAAGKRDLALPLLEETLKLSKARLGPKHPDTLQSMNNLATAYRAAGKRDLALPLFEQTLKLQKAKLGPEHPSTLTTMHNLAMAYRAAGKLDLALPLCEETLKLMKARLGPKHPDTLISMGTLAQVYQAVGQRDLAVPLFEETLKLMKAKLGREHPHTLTTMNNLAAAYWRAKQLDKSIPLFEETLKLCEAKCGRDHPDTLLTVANLGVNYNDAGRLTEAIPLLEEAYRAAKKYPKLRWVGPPLLDAYAKAGQHVKFANLLQEQLAEARKALPKDSPQLAGLLAQGGRSLLKQKKEAEAEPLLRECLLIRAKTQPDEWRTFNTKSALGGALLGQKKYADAEPLLLAGYEGMKKREAKIPLQGKVRLIEAVERLVQLYEATGKKDEVKKWQAERAKYSVVGPMPREKK